MTTLGGSVQTGMSQYKHMGVINSNKASQGAYKRVNESKDVETPSSMLTDDSVMYGDGVNKTACLSQKKATFNATARPTYSEVDSHISNVKSRYATAVYTSAKITPKEYHKTALSSRKSFNF